MRDLDHMNRVAALHSQFNDLVREGDLVAANRFLEAHLLPKPPLRSGLWLRGAVLSFEMENYEEAARRYETFLEQFPREEESIEANADVAMIGACIYSAHRGRLDALVAAIADATDYDPLALIELRFSGSLQTSPRMARVCIDAYRRFAPSSDLPILLERILERRINDR